MVVIRPVSEEKANDKIKAIYSEIRTTLGISNIPIVFQLLAFFETYFNYIWEKLKPNLTSDSFSSEINNLEQTTSTFLKSIYQPSDILCLFLDQIKKQNQIYDLTQTVNKLTNINTALFLLTLSLRESLKGVNIGVKKIKARTYEPIKKDVYEHVVFENSTKSSQTLKKQISPFLKKGIIPKIEGKQLIVIAYPRFYQLISWDFAHLQQKQEFLETRIKLEQDGLKKILNLPFQLDSSFQTVAERAAENKYFPELLYLLAELLPTQAAWKVLLTLMMKIAVNPQTFS